MTMIKKAVAGLLASLLLAGCDEIPRNAFPSYPSCDWGYEESYYLAVAAANIDGSPREKEQEIISVLDAVWYEKIYVSIEDYVKEIYDEIEPEPIDFAVLDCVKEKVWYDEAYGSDEE